MHVVFRPLFRIRVRHGWYPDGATRDDFAVAPTPSTAALLESLALRFRRYADGLVVFGEVEPGSSPAVLRRSIGATSLRFAFELHARNLPLLNITDLQRLAPAPKIFCFDNLRQDIDPDPALAFKYLGNAVAAARVGPSVQLVSSGVYTYELGAPAAQALITVTDRFGRIHATLDARSPDPAQMLTSYRIDLDAIATVVPGRYVISDDHGRSVEIYYDPELGASRPFGVIEIFSRTEGFTPDASNRVPAAYRFLNGDVVTGQAYYVQLQPVATTWRYRVVKKYANNGIALNQLTIAGPIPFTPQVSGTTATFTSNAPVRLSKAPRALKLRKVPNSDIRDLPNPDLTTPLGMAPPLPNFVSDMFVTV